MDPAIKKVVAVLAAALIVVIGVICVINFANKDAAVTTDNGIKTQENQNIENKQADADAEPNAEEKPTDEAQAGEAGVTQEAQSKDAAQENEMYEGALAGLSEDEIAKMALAEEESAARTETTGAEDAVD